MSDLKDANPIMVASPTWTGAIRTAAVLSFIAAFVDTFGFIQLAGLFTAHVTGNFVLIGASTVRNEAAQLSPLLAFPVFVAGVAGTAWLSRVARRSGNRMLPALLAVQGILLAIACALALEAPSAVDKGHVMLGAGMALVLAMGIQNALMRLELATSPATTVMTGNVTQAVIDVVDTLSEGEIHPERSIRLKRTGAMIAAFTVGAAAGALGAGSLGWDALILPIFLCLFLARRAFTVSAAVAKL